jgi:hypothetical protein
MFSWRCISTAVSCVYNYVAIIKIEGSWGLAHLMSLTELALLDGRRPLPLGDVIGLTLTLTLIKIGKVSTL